MLILLLSLAACGDKDTNSGGYYTLALVDAICACKGEGQAECAQFIEQNVYEDFSVAGLSDMDDYCVTDAAQEADCYGQLQESALNCEPLVAPECEALAALEPC